MKKKSKKHQIKSQWYYIFWGIATIAVVGGQIYVGSGYRDMSTSFKGYVENASCRQTPSEQ